MMTLRWWLARSFQRTATASTVVVLHHGYRGVAVPLALYCPRPSALCGNMSTSTQQKNVLYF